MLDLQGVREQVVILMAVCSADTSHGRAQLVAYRRVIAVIDGEPMGFNTELPWLAKFEVALSLIAYHDEVVPEYPLREWFIEGHRVNSAQL